MAWEWEELLQVIIGGMNKSNWADFMVSSARRYLISSAALQHKCLQNKQFSMGETFFISDIWFNLLNLLMFGTTKTVRN